MCVYIYIYIISPVLHFIVSRFKKFSPVAFCQYPTNHIFCFYTTYCTKVLLFHLLYRIFLSLIVDPASPDSKCVCRVHHAADRCIANMAASRYIEEQMCRQSLLYFHVFWNFHRLLLCDTVTHFLLSCLFSECMYRGLYITGYFG